MVVDEPRCKGSERYDELVQLEGYQSSYRFGIFCDLTHLCPEAEESRAECHRNENSPGDIGLRRAVVCSTSVDWDSWLQAGQWRGRCPGSLPKGGGRCANSDEVPSRTSPV